MVVYAQRDARFRAIVNACALSLCDTVGLLAVARWRGAALRDRVTGVELVDRLCAGAASAGLPVYLLGGRSGVAADAAAILQARFPGLVVAGARNGFFAEGESADIAAAIAASGARLLFVGHGLAAPRVLAGPASAADRLRGGHRRRRLVRRHRGSRRRAPAPVRRLGLEWLYRLIKEPRRWKRQLALPRFVWLVALDGLGVRKSGAGS